MIRFFWKYRYVNLTVLSLFFVLGCINFTSLNVYFDSERIIELSNVDDNIIEKSLDDKNLLLVGLKFSDSLTISQLQELRSKIDRLSSDKNIANIKSVFNEKHFIASTFVPIGVNMLSLEDSISFNQSINRIKELQSNFITSDLKNLLFILKCRNLITDEQKAGFLTSLENQFTFNNLVDINITGQIKSELYMQENVIKELILYAILSIFLCSIILFYFTKSIYLVVINLISVSLSVFFSFSLSNYLFGGIELVMIIVPAVIFIITISDYMHLQNISNFYNNGYRLFRNQISVVGKPVVLTSLTTAIGFLSFTFTDFQPLMRFGVITSLSIFISLLIIVILFSFCVELRLFKRKRNLPRIDKLLSSVISIEKYQKTLLLFFIALTSFGCYNLKIDNYLSDEINEKSELFSQINYFDKTFGGIKPLSFKINDRLDYDRLQDFSKLLKSYNVNIDFTLYKGYTSVISSRMNDIGSLKSNIIYDQIIDYSKKDGFDTNISGIGYLFDKISNRLTIEVLIGLVIAILIIGLLFVVLNGFNLNYLLVALIPNLIPLFTCLGILSFSGFYFSLSNAFIFAIVFGLIVDDSIHIISAYSISRKNNLSIQQSISYCRKNTMQAVLKTTLVVIFTLIPLLFSEFRSISQLSYITILTACIALIFDIVFLPKILVRYIR